MKKSIKLINIILLVIILFLAFWKIYKANKVINNYKDKLLKIKTLKKKYNQKYLYIGRKLTLNNFKSLKNNKSLKLIKNDSKYLFLLIITKYNCPKCISKFVYNLNRFYDENVQILITGYNKNNMYKRKKQYHIKKPIFYINKYSWFENNNFNKGPIAVILDRNTRKILNIFKGVTFINDREVKIVRYLKYLNK